MTPKSAIASVLVRGERMVPLIAGPAACRYLWALGEDAYQTEAWARACEYFGLCTDYAPELAQPETLRRFVRAAAEFPDDVIDVSTGVSRRVAAAWRMAAANVIDQLGDRHAAR